MRKVVGLATFYLEFYTSIEKDKEFAKDFSVVVYKFLICASEFTVNCGL